MGRSEATTVPEAVLTAMPTRVFCQIGGRDIGQTNCLQTQGQEGCFGCAAETRLCEQCHKAVVAVPAVGLCDRCLEQELKHEAGAAKPEFAPSMRVTCQIVQQEIAARMCVATQGQEGCKDCTAPTRLCERCHDHPQRFAQYGLCLACTVAEHGDGWEPHDAAEDVNEPTDVAELADEAERLLHSKKPISCDAIARELGVDEATGQRVFEELERRRVTTPATEIRGYRVRAVGTPDQLIAGFLERQHPGIHTNPAVAHRALSDLQRGRNASYVEELGALNAAELKAARGVAALDDDAEEGGGSAMPKKPGHARKGFASMTMENRRRIASLGGKAAHAQGTAHQWTSREAVAAGRKGGLTHSASRSQPARHEVSTNAGRERAPFDDLVEQARRYIVATGRTASRDLQRELSVGRPTAKRILSTLEQQGVVGPATKHPGRPRAVLVQTSPTAANRGQNVCIKPETLERARKLVRETGRMSVTFLQKSLGTEFYRARRVRELLLQEGAGTAQQPVDSTTASPRADGVSSSTTPLTPAQKIRYLHQLLAVLGEKSEHAPMLQAIVQDLENLRELRARLRLLGAGR